MRQAGAELKVLRLETVERKVCLSTCEEAVDHVNKFRVELLLFQDVNHPGMVYRGEGQLDVSKYGTDNAACPPVSFDPRHQADECILAQTAPVCSVMSWVQEDHIALCCLRSGLFQGFPMNLSYGVQERYGSVGALQGIATLSWLCQQDSFSHFSTQQDKAQRGDGIGENQDMVADGFPVQRPGPGLDFSLTWCLHWVHVLQGFRCI